MSHQPTSDPDAIPRAITALFHNLIVQLAETKTLTVEQGKSVFDFALERARKERPDAPDVEGTIQYMRDNLKWDALDQLSKHRP
jgi:hypothetical protein